MQRLSAICIRTHTYVHTGMGLSFICHWPLLQCACLVFSVAVVGRAGSRAGISAFAFRIPANRKRESLIHERVDSTGCQPILLQHYWTWYWADGDVVKTEAEGASAYCLASSVYPSPPETYFIGGKMSRFQSVCV